MRPEKFSELESKFTLVRYVLPSGWKDRPKIGYSTLHIQLRQQLNATYYVFQYDKLYEIKQKVIYVLYPN
ncbi:MAG: hypothetical protein AAFY41_12495, partial [Bacteroidota bacterium]